MGALNYKLAKELKEAGYSQDLWCDCNGPIQPSKADEPCVVPSLSDLIDSCGEEFERLEYQPSPKCWTARQMNYGFYDDKACVNGKTPEEAVALLWLELNKK